jgi:hypothetical protein
LSVLAGHRHRELLANASVWKDMPKFHSSVCQDLSDEQASVTVTRISLAAQQRDPMVSGSTDEALDSTLERLHFRHRPVQRVALVIVVLIADRTPSKLLPEEEIANSPPPHRHLDLLPIEMRSEA